jgi:type VI secretion system protein ImpG
MKALPIETSLAQYYQAELSALRAEAEVFARQHPGTAADFGLGKGRALDPHVELLLQSFAFMSGRLRHHVEVDKSRVPNALAEALYPHLGAPVPSMVMAHATDVQKKALMLRHQGLSAETLTDKGAAVQCRFRLGCTTTLLPLAVERVQLRAADKTTTAAAPEARSTIAIELAKAPGAKLETETLRFFIDTDSVTDAFVLYELLALHLAGIGLEGAPHAARAARLHWRGFSDHEALLPATARTPSGYRVLQEYFAFPQKYMMFEVGPLDLSAMGEHAVLQLALDEPYERAREWRPEGLRLNCMPLVNLFAHPLEPITLDHAAYEYRLVSDYEQHRHHEIHSLEKLYSVRANGSVRKVEPYFGFDELDGAASPEYFYIGRRERSEATGVAGGEYFISFLDCRLDPATLEDEVIGGTALCTNRRLPEHLATGTALRIEGAGPDVSLATIGHASPHTMPAQIGERPWALVSQLALNRLSLSDGPDALRALKEILRLHAGQDRAIALRQIEGIGALSCRTVMRHHKRPGWRGFVRTLRVDVRLDRHAFTDASPVLFWQVLRHFFALYASVNTLIETGFSTNDCSGSDEGWTPLEGEQCVL